MTDDLWHHFDRIRAFLLRQDAQRETPGFGAWLVSALPHIARHLDAVAAAEDECYGAVLCDWLDWLDARRYAYRGRLTWQIPTAGPVIFTPPSQEGLMRRLGELLEAAGLVEYTRALCRLRTAGPKEKSKSKRRGRKKKA